MRTSLLIILVFVIPVFSIALMMTGMTMKNNGVIAIGVILILADASAFAIVQRLNKERGKR